MTGSKAAAASATAADAGACEIITKLWYLEIWANIWQIWIMLWNVAQLLLEEPAVMTGLEIQKCMGCMLGHAASGLVSRINHCCSTVVDPHFSMTDKPKQCNERHREDSGRRWGKLCLELTSARIPHLVQTAPER